MKYIKLFGLVLVAIVLFTGSYIFYEDHLYIVATFLVSAGLVGLSLAGGVIDDE